MSFLCRFSPDDSLPARLSISLSSSFSQPLDLTRLTTPMTLWITSHLAACRDGPDASLLWPHTMPRANASCAPLWDTMPSWSIFRLVLQLPAGAAACVLKSLPSGKALSLCPCGMPTLTCLCRHPAAGSQRECRCIRCDCHQVH